MKDPYIVEMFNFMENLYDRNINKHFIITTDAIQYNNFNYLEPILIDNNKNLGLYLDEIIDNSISINTRITQPIEIESNYSKVINTKSKIAILFPLPIDKDTNFNIDIVTDCFNNLEVELTFLYFNLESLNKIIDFDYVIIFSHLVKNKLLIEDEYLKSKNIEIDELQEYYSKSIKGIFLFYTGEVLQLNSGVAFPITLINYEEKKIKDVLTNFIYKAFKKSEIDLLTKSSLVFHSNLFCLSKLERGNVSKIQYIPNISKYIDKKNLNKFIGRKTDLENIIRKIIETKYDDKVLTIKGAGGIGKTLTTTKAAFELCQRGHFNKGLYFIACDSVNTLENFIYEISICFDLTSSKDLIRQVQENHVYKNRLIILDNFETILYSDDRNQIINLVSDICEYATVIITSRQLLRLNFEDVYELRNFTTDEGVELFKSIYKHVSTQEEIILRREIVERLLNNNPLAIKLISKGLVSHKSIILLQKELEADIFKFGDIEIIFEGKEDINIEKSHSLYHSVNYSYQKLTDKEKVAFELLSLFPDGIHLENFKKFSKTLIGKITIEDKDIKELDNKSLLENNNGLLKLQSIINRFAEHQFQKRDDDYKLSCYENIFGYNSFFADLYSNRGIYSVKEAIKIQDANVNNYLKSLSTFPLLNISLERKINFIDDIHDVFLSTNQPKNFLKELDNIESTFKENERIYKYIQLIKNYTIYWTKDFKESSFWIYNNYPIESIRFDQSRDFLDTLSYFILRSFYFCEGESFSILTKNLNSTSNSMFVGDLLFEIGYFSGAEVAYQIWNKGEFFFWELQAATHKLSLLDIDNYLKSIYKKDTLEIIQTMYTKLKLFNISNNEIKKLPVSNPYTQGLIYLMLAKNENSNDEKRILYLKAIENLVNIKYYYSEAIYYFSEYLLEINDDEFEYWFELGVKTSTNYNFNFLLYKFEQLKNPDLIIYDEENRISKELKEQIDFYLEGYRNQLEEVNKKTPALIRR